jgi:FkbM family methyltransferase
MPSFTGLIRRTYNGAIKRFTRILISNTIRFQRGRFNLVGLGTGEGTWVVPIDLIRPEWICYCVGVGIDASFDIALSELGARVFSFDPTPRAIEYMRTLNYDRKRITFQPIGIWKEDRELKFFAPMNRQHTNYSIRDIHGTFEYFTADCFRVSTIMTKLGHDHLDLLKLDIEGSWYEVLQNIISERIPISVLCVEFDTPTSPFRALSTIRALRSIGFEAVHNHRDNFLFIRNSSDGGALRARNSP